MKLIEQSHVLEYMTPDADQLIERAGRVCYKSEDKITPESSIKFLRSLLKSGHHSVLEHAHASVRFITNRGVTHELVRHRLASYSQESTRYVNYAGKEMEFIKPVWIEHAADKINANPTLVLDNAGWEFYHACFTSEIKYKSLLSKGWRPEQAREVLPNALKTEIVMTANFREWMHVFKLRCSKRAHPQIRALMLQCLGDFSTRSEVFQYVMEEVTNGN